MQQTFQVIIASYSALRMAMRGTSIFWTITERRNAMPMFDPAHPGEIIKSDIDALGITITEAASRLGVDKSQLSRVVNRRSAVSAEMAVRLEAVIGGTADHYLRMQAAFDLAQVRQNKADITRGLRRLTIGS
jgi:addiction module HigA family antidote